MASSSSSPRPWKYDVFLSFRGEDTRKNFVDHLYTALCRKVISAFKDDEELRIGQEIRPELLKAIEESRFAIIIFSENYASSTWCLDELVKILECKKEMGQRVLPVFHYVEPSQIRKQCGSLEAAFDNHQRVFGVNSEKVLRWRTALREAVDITGCETRIMENGYESKCIDKIVTMVRDEIPYPISSANKNLVGIECRVKEVISMLQIESDDVRIIGIWGMGGIGKTTLAEEVFDQISYRFEYRSFLKNVRDNEKRHNLERLQEKLLSDIFMVEHLNTSNGYECYMKNKLRYKRVLLVLDDVNDIGLIDKLVVKRDLFGLGSKIIITTREQRLLSLCKVDDTHAVKFLTDGEAIQLFSRNAFDSDHPKEGFEELSNHVVCHADGLPLALVVLGRFLYKRKTAEWRSALNRLKEIPEKKILEVLEISFDGLDCDQKKIFLDIACFFRGRKRTHIVRKLESFDFHAEIVISILIEKCLIIDSPCGRIEMHDLIQEMGQHIVCKDYLEEVERRSRLWRPTDVCNVLAKNKESKAVEGIMFVLPYPRDITFSGDAFRKMNKLRFLKVKNANLSQGPNYLPNSLRCLNWHGYPSKSLPESFEPQNLVELKMCYSRIIQPWMGIKKFGELKFINFSHSQKLTRTPDFTEVPNLETLILESCTSLVVIHPSIKVLTKLRLLNLKNCKTLKSLPSSICMLKCLTTLLLSGCSKLDKLPENLGQIECLEQLLLCSTAITQLPPSFGHLKNLEILSFRGCKGTSSQSLSSLLSSWLLWRKCQDSMGLVLPSLLGVCSLRKLDLRNCNLLDGGLPSDIGCLLSLEILDLSRNNFVRLPDISRLSRLEILRVIGCKRLEALPELPSNMKDLFAENCRSLKSVASVKYLSLRHIGLTNCLKLLKNQRSKDIAYILLRYVLQGLDFFDRRFGIVVPGGEIPEWFGYQNSGGELFMQLPPDWYVKNFMGLAVCFVSEFTTAKYIVVHLKLGAPDGIKFSESFCMGFRSKKFKISSEHVWLGYLSAEIFNDLTQPEDCCLLELSIRNESLDEGVFGIKNCAARLVYEEDTNVSAEAVAEHNDGAEVSGSGSCDDDDDNNDNVDNDDDVDDDEMNIGFCLGAGAWQQFNP